MENKNTLPDQILENFDNLQFEQVTAAELKNFTVTVIENGCGCITLCGVYPLTGMQCVFSIYCDEESAYMQYQRAIIS